ncbi:MAG: lactate dehydrogenase, partial [Hyphomonadaceae bacterium]|nr:lactate dehydrogenase [Hyphomonadaceae bacterium]
EQKEDLKAVFEGRTKLWKSLDYVTGWFMKAADYGTHVPSSSTAFVATNSICQGQQVPILWSLIFRTGHEICFAHTSFKWANLASHNAGVTVVIVGMSGRAGPGRRLYVPGEGGKTLVRACDNINAYLVAGPDIRIAKRTKPLGPVGEMIRGNMPVDGGHLLLNRAEMMALGLTPEQKARFIRLFLGSAEFIQGRLRYCLWIEDEHLQEAMDIAPIRERVEKVRQVRLASRDRGANRMAARSHQMREMNTGKHQTIIVPGVSSENREYLPCGLLPPGATVSNKIFALYDAPLWNLALIASRLHLVWIGAVCGKLKTDFRYSNTLGWNTFPVPFLTEKNRTDLTRCAIDILLAREAHFPDTIAELYEPDNMPANLRAAHDFNDEKVERIFIGRRFKNDSERLEKLFTIYTKMTAGAT